MKAIKQYFSVVPYAVQAKVVLTFQSVDEIVKCDHSNETIEQYFPVKKTTTVKTAVKRLRKRSGKLKKTSASRVYVGARWF